MPEAANALHSDEISTTQARVAKSVIGRDTGTEKWSGFRGCQLIRNGSEGAGFGDHYFRISSIRGYSRHHRVLTIHTVSATARFTDAVFAGNEADTNPLTGFPFGRSAAEGIDAANHFMSGNTRQSEAGVNALDRGRIGVTDSAC